jgi:hypothetical protein
MHQSEKLVENMCYGTEVRRVSKGWRGAWERFLATHYPLQPFQWPADAAKEAAAAATEGKKGAKKKTEITVVPIVPLPLGLQERRAAEVGLISAGTALMLPTLRMKGMKGGYGVRNLDARQISGLAKWSLKWSGYTVYMLENQVKAGMRSN